MVSFDAALFEIARSAFSNHGKGRGHPARLNVGDGLADAVAKARSRPLPSKGNDFIQTDLMPACSPAA